MATLNELQTELLEIPEFRSRHSMARPEIEYNNQSIIKHFKSISLLPQIRTGFSLLNLTGQSVRYLQQWENGKQSFYL
jgi:hypothetical protein